MGPQARREGRANFHRQQSKRSRVEGEEIAAIEALLGEQAPPAGSNPLSLEPDPARPTFASARRFEDMPLSQATKDALREAKFTTMTAIQRATLPHALAGRDVLGAAKTGSGKTLAFLVPLVEKLYRARWGRLDGLGGLVVSPTRELAMQIFDELQRVGRRHELSAGLLIGGKDVKEEQSRVNGLNVLVATPGRLLQHMDETPGFDASSLQILVLDEADRILDMGFSATLDAILGNLPPDRQTLLFSATQTRHVRDLARLSLVDPQYLAVHADAAAATPLKLEQAYLVCDLPAKLDILWSFIKTHLRCKVIVFLSTCKQVRFLFEAFRRLRPGVPLRALHGRMNQFKRMGVFYEYCEAKSMVLFATDIAARGLDFPSVDWVVQADCPEGSEAYIHRVGRTARYVSSGKGLLLLLPSERDGMLAALAAAKIPIKAIKHNPSKVQPVTPALQALLSKDKELKEVAQRALSSYFRSVFLQPDRSVFDVTALPAADFALSMGLPSAPKLRFLKKGGKRAAAPSAAAAAAAAKAGGGGGSEDGGSDSGADSGSGDEDEDEGRAALAAAAAAAGSDSEDGGSGSGDEEASASGSGSDDGEDLLVVKRTDVHGVRKEEAEAAVAAAAAAVAAAEAGRASKKKKRTRIDPGKVAGAGRVVFDEEGRAMNPLELLAQDGANFGGGGDAGVAAKGKRGSGLDTGVHASVEERAAAARAVMLSRDKADRRQMQELKKRQRDEKRARRLEREQEERAVAVRGPGDDSSDGSGASDSGGSESDLEDEGRERRRGGRQGDEGGADLDLLDSGSDDDEGVPHRPSGTKRSGGSTLPEVSHLGMLPAGAGAAAKRAGGEPAGAGGGGKRARKGPDPSALSLAEQEALALRLLAGQK